MSYEFEAAFPTFRHEPGKYPAGMVALAVLQGAKDRSCLRLSLEFGNPAHSLGRERARGPSEHDMFVFLDYEPTNWPGLHASSYIARSDSAAANELETDSSRVTGRSITRPIKSRFGCSLGAPAVVAARSTRAPRRKPSPSAPRPVSRALFRAEGRIDPVQNGWERGMLHRTRRYIGDFGADIRRR